MATLTIRDLDEDLKARLRVQAAQHGRSMEAEVREILRASVAPSAPERDIGSLIRQRFADLDDASLPLPDRSELPRVPELPE